MIAAASSWCKVDDSKDGRGSEEKRKIGHILRES